MWRKAADVNRSLGRRHQITKGAPSGKIRDMDSGNAGPARRGQGGPRSAAGSSERGWGLLLVWFAGNILIATLAWFIVGWFLK
jgi:hypothetical protein